MKLGEPIRRCRMRLGISQKMLSEKSNLTQGYISNVEHGRQQPSTKALKKICMVLKVPPALIVMMGMEKSDAKVGKKNLYTKLRPVIDALIDEVLNITYGK